MAGLGAEPSGRVKGAVLGGGWPQGFWRAGNRGDSEGVLTVGCRVTTLLRSGQLRVPRPGCPCWAQAAQAYSEAEAGWGLGGRQA